MPLSRPSLDELETRVLTRFDTEIPDGDARLPASEEQVLATVHAGAIHGLYGYLQWIQKQCSPLDCDGDMLDRLHGSVWGITRRPATQATGTLTLTGTPGSTLPLGSLFQRADGLQVTTTQERTLTTGTATVAVQAVPPGSQGNLSAGAIFSAVNPTPGIVATATASALTGGTDTESHEAYRARILTRIRNAPQGGSLADYQRWALEVPGITRAYPYGSELFGGGSVAVFILMDDTYPGGIPQPADVALVQAWMDDPARRPITAEVLVIAPTAVPLNLSIAIAPNTEAVRAAVTNELKDLIRREATPGGTLLLSHIRETISTTVGELDHNLTSPTTNVTVPDGSITILGTINWTDLP